MMATCTKVCLDPGVGMAWADMGYLVKGSGEWWMVCECIPPPAREVCAVVAVRGLRGTDTYGTRVLSLSTCVRFIDALRSLPFSCGAGIHSRTIPSGAGLF